MKTDIEMYRSSYYKYAFFFLFFLFLYFFNLKKLINNLIEQ